MRKPSSVREFNPSLALRSGTADAWAVLLLWCYRKSWLPLLWIGLIIATLAGLGDRVDEQLTGNQSVGEMLRALLSPLAGVVLSIIVRITAGIFAWLLAYPLSRWTSPEMYGSDRGMAGTFRLWRDRIHLTSAYRALRWSWAVRQVAAERIGAAGHRLMRCNTLMLWANVVLVLVYFAVAVATL